MAKNFKRAQDKLDRRIKSWAVTIKSLPTTANSAAFRKPGSMKRKRG